MSSQPIEFSPDPANHPRKLTNLHIEHERLMDCIHCGLCLSSCPTYVQNGQEADSPRGRIYLMRALYEERIEPTPDVVEHLDACLGCRACETACPSGVQYGSLIEGTRAHLRESGVQKSLKDRAILKGAESIFPYPNRLESVLLPVRVLRRTGVLPLLRKSGVMRLLGRAGELEMLLPDLPPMRKRLNFPERWKARREVLEGEASTKVALLTGCVMQVMQTGINVSTARVLTEVGCDVAAPKAQNCCGAMHAHTGAMETAKELARKNIEVFETWERENGPLEAIVVNAAGCGSALKEYPVWFKGEEQWEARAKAFAGKVRDISEFLVQPLFKNRLQAAIRPPKLQKGQAKKRATYHDACHLAHGQGIRSAPRELLALLPDWEMIPLPESEMCCGSAGTYNITQPEMANALLKRKMEKIESTGAKVCTTGNVGCAMQLMLGARLYGPNVQIKHPIELLDEATRKSDS